MYSISVGYLFKTLVFISIGSLYYLPKNCIDAVKYFQQALQKQIIPLMPIFRSEHILEAKEGRYQNALHHMTKALGIRILQRNYNHYEIDEMVACLTERRISHTHPHPQVSTNYSKRLRLSKECHIGNDESTKIFSPSPYSFFGIYKYQSIGKRKNLLLFFDESDIRALSNTRDFG